MDFTAVDPLLKRPAVQHILQNTPLPNEVCDAIADLVRPQDLVHCWYLSRNLRHSVNPILYHTVVFDWSIDPGSNREPPAHLLLRSILNNPSLACHIRSLSLIGMPNHHWRRRAFGYGDRTRPPISANPHMHKIVSARGVHRSVSFSLAPYSETERELLRASIMAGLPGQSVRQAKRQSPFHEMVLGQLLLRTKSLRHLRVDSDFLWCPNVRASLHTVLDLSAGMHSAEDCLRSVEFCLDMAQLGRFQEQETRFAIKAWRKLLEKPLGMRGLRRIATGAILRGDVVQENMRYFDALVPEITKQGDSCLSNLRSLTLVHFEQGPSWAERLFAQTPNLELLDYSQELDWRWAAELHRRWKVTQADVDPIGRALWPIRASLRHLTIHQHLIQPKLTPPRDLRHIYQDDKIVMRTFPLELRALTALVPTRLSHLKEFWRLESLAVPWVMLLGWQHAAQPFPIWDELLPLSLKHITWFHDLCELQGDIWNEEDMLSAVDRFCEWVSLSSRSSQDLVLTLWIEIYETSFTYGIGNLTLIYLRRTAEDYGTTIHLVDNGVKPNLPRVIGYYGLYAYNDHATRLTIGVPHNPVGVRPSTGRAGPSW